jgi:hypothetical protein
MDFEKPTIEEFHEILEPNGGLNESRHAPGTSLEIPQPVPKNGGINPLSDNADQGVQKILSESLLTEPASSSN